MVEHFHATVKSMLRKVLPSFDQQWDRALPYILFTYREVPSEATGFPPLEITYGRKIQGPLDVLSDEWTAKRSTPESVSVLIHRIHDRLEQVQLLAGEIGESQKKQMKRYYDRSAKETHFDLGNQVLVPTSTARKVGDQMEGSIQCKGK